MPVAKIHGHEGAFDESELSAIGLTRPEGQALPVDSARRDFLKVGMGAAAGGLALGLTQSRASAQTPSAASSHNTAPTQYVESAGVRFAYRRLGANEGVPLILLQHFRGTMDWWDPKLTDGLARTRPVVLFDNRGVGLSGGATPNTIDAMAEDTATFIEALGLKQVDVLGFSIGGFIAQELALKRADLLRRVILAGTGPRGGQGMQENTPEVAKAATSANPGPTRAFLFFSPSKESQAAAAHFLARTAERRVDLDPASSNQTMQAQSEAIQEWGLADSKVSYLARLRRCSLPFLIVNGSNDIMVPTVNAFALSQAIPKAELIIYPDAGHGSIFQYADLFVEHAKLFLDRTDKGLS